jgi:protein O-GlcNAc transferase
VPALDYYLSSRLIEPVNAQDLYSERLLMLGTLPMYLREDHGGHPKYSRTELGLPDHGAVYLCPMKLHKVHPDMDLLVQEILARDGSGRVVFFADDRRTYWTRVLTERMTSTIEAMDRVVFLPFEPDLQRFRAIIASADVILDTPHHGGGTTINMAISVGTPIVSYVGATARGRGPHSFYAMMGISEGICQRFEDYASCAVTIARDKALRSEISRVLIEQRYLYHRNKEVVEAYREQFRVLSEFNAMRIVEKARCP